MFDRDKWQEIFATIRKNKLRTLLTALGVFWGIFMLVVLQGAGNGLKNGVEREFGEEAKSSIWVWQGKTSVAYDGLQPGRVIRFENEDLINLANQIEDLEVVAPRNRLYGTYTLTYKDKSGSFTTFGALGDFFKINGEKLKEGRLLNYQDEKERRKVVVLGEKAKDVIFEGVEGSVIGKYINVRDVPFKVVGIFNNSDNGGRNEERAYIPFSTLQMVFNQPNQVHLLALSTKAGASPEKVQKQIRRVLGKKHQFDPEDTQAIGMNSNEENFNRIMMVINAIKFFVGFVGIMTLIAGIVGVSNIMLIIVKERTKEIGIRKAMGATPFSIISLIIQESIFITAISGYLGMLAGIGLLELFKFLISMIESSGGSLPYFTAPEIGLEIAIGSTIVLVIAGALAGLMPALKAARIKPVEALASE